MNDRLPAPSDSPTALAAALRSTGYLADDGLATATFLAMRMNRPLFCEGEPGTGKTALAQALAEITGAELIRLQCHDGIDASQALYDWDFPRQLLHLRALETAAGADKLDVDAVESSLYDKKFLLQRPILRALQTTPSVLLIDEVDRADEALEAVLLETLAEWQVSVPEVGTFTTKTPPYVVLTSNNTRDLSAALKRRCLHLFLDYPTAERELEIVRSKNTGLPDALAQQLVGIVRGLRELELRKSPSISETIDWARTLAVLGVEELTATILSDTASVVVKYDKDVRKAIGALPRLVDPNATVPETNGHGHGHGHGGHDDHAHDPEPVRKARTDDEDGDEVDGRAIRAAKDTPGRFGHTYGSNPLSGDGGASPIKPPKVPAERGARSFGAGLGRKRAL